MLGLFKRGREEGANLVEFALLAPLLIILLLGIIEFGFLMGEWNEVKHGAHEGARLAAVDDSDFVDRTCDSMALHSSSTTVDVTFTGGGTIGDQGTVVVTASNVSSLSGLGIIEVFLPTTISADADFRIEQDSSWSDPTTATC